MTGKGRPAFSSAYICSICLAICAFHGGGLLRSCATWSLMTGVQTPLKSGSLASACQSRSVAGGLIGSLAAGSAASEDGSVLAANAARIIAATARLMGIFMHRKITLFELHNEALMNPRVPLKVLRHGRGADVLDRQILEPSLVQLEAGVVGGKHQAACGPQQFQRPANHADVIALHVEHALHALGIRKGRRIQEDQVEARTSRLLLLEPGQAIGAVEFVIVAPKAIEQKLFMRPVKIGVG